MGDSIVTNFQFKRKKSHAKEFIFFEDSEGFIIRYFEGKYHFAPTPFVTMGRPIEFAHQLQNFYYLYTGEEIAAKFH